MPADHEPLTGEVPVRASRRTRVDRSPVTVVSVLMAVSSIFVAGHAGGAASAPQWLQPAPTSVAGPYTDPALEQPEPSTPSVSSVPVAATTRPTETPDSLMPVSLAAGLGADLGSTATQPTAPLNEATSPETTPSTEPTSAPFDPDNGGANRPIPVAPDETAPSGPAPGWAASVRTTGAGFVTTDLGCAAGTSAAALDAFFSRRIGPVIGMDYQHVYPLGGGRYLWLFQDTFVDQSGAASRLGQASFVHNTAVVQDGACFTLSTRGTPARPLSFEPGAGESPLQYWIWPMGGALVNGQLRVFWAEMRKDGDPGAGNGLGWHPARTWLATYDTHTLARLDFRLAPNPGASPIYGYAVDSDAEHTYLFANTFEQNLDREGGYGNGPHSGTKMFLGRVPLGRLDAAPEYYTPDGWTTDASQAQPISQRYWVENPMQPRFLDGRWVAATKVDGYWGEQLAIDVANHPWGPWTTTEVRGLAPRGDWSVMNTYHAHLMPWLDGSGRLVVSYSQNARNMLRDAWPHPDRYRPAFTTAAFGVPPPDVVVTDPETSTTIDASTTIPESTAPDTSPPETTVTTTTEPPTTTTPPSSSSPTTTTTTTTTSTTTSTTTTTTTTAPP